MWRTKMNNNIVIIGKKSFICGVCKKPFESYQKNRKYCSSKCYWKVFSKNQLGEKNPAWKDYFDYNTLYKEYIINKKSISYICKKYNCSCSYLYKRFKLYNIKPRGYYKQKEIEDKNQTNIKAHQHQIVIGSNKRNRKEYLNIAKTNKIWICEMCNKERSKDRDLVVHHIDKNNKNNNVNNLMVLCNSCHAKIHKIGGRKK